MKIQISIRKLEWRHVDASFTIRERGSIIIFRLLIEKKRSNTGYYNFTDKDMARQVLVRWL